MRRVKEKDEEEPLFTIKQVEPHGYEGIYPGVEFVSFQPSNVADPGSEDMVRAHRANDVLQFTYGTVYVMNETGATIGRYILARPTTPSDPALGARNAATAENRAAPAAESAPSQSNETVAARRQTENGWAT